VFPANYCDNLHNYLQLWQIKHYLYDSDGSCLVWTLWYLDFRLRNKNVPRSKAFEKLLKTSQVILKQFVNLK